MSHYLAPMDRAIGVVGEKIIVDPGASQRVTNRVSPNVLGA